jgi:hypothetical protein
LAVGKLDILTAHNVVAFPSAQFEMTIALKSKVSGTAGLHFTVDFHLSALILARDTRGLRLGAGREQYKRDRKNQGTRGS